MFLGYFCSYYVFNFQGYIYGIFWTQLGIGLMWLTFMFNGLQVFATELMYTSNQEFFDNCGDWFMWKLGRLSKQEYDAKVADRSKYYKID